MAKLTEKSYWDEGYDSKGGITSIHLTDYKDLFNRQIFNVFCQVDLKNKNILELGGGGSAWILLLASMFSDSKFTVIDYSESGCLLLQRAVQERGLENVNIKCMDFFQGASQFDEHFDIIYSFGVFEHFEDLSKLISSVGGMLKKQGTMITFIPNMAGILGALTKFLNKAIYDIHVPYNKEQLVAGHRNAELTVTDAKYLGSTNFGVLSSCVEETDGWKWQMYKRLSQLSKAIWFFESKLFELPASRLLSPYIFVIAEK